MEVPILETIEYLREMGERLALYRATKKIGIYNGDKEGFIDWIKGIEVQSIVHSFGIASIVKLVLNTTKGPITNFILSFLDGNLTTEGSALKAYLVGRYTTVKTTEENTNTSNEPLAVRVAEN